MDILYGELTRRSILALQPQKFTILAVDDSEDILNLVELTLGKEHVVRLAPDGPTALRVALEEPRPDLILLDVEMPGPSGYDVCRSLKGIPAVADVPVIFLTNRSETRDVVEGFQLGAIDYLAKPISPPVLAARVRTHLELIARRNQQEEIIRQRTTQLEHTRLQLIRRLGRAMEYHETSAVGNRVVRLGHYARTLAQAAGARPLMCDLIMKAAPLHDIGKVGVPASILRKTGTLTVPEREQMQRHPEIGAEIIGEHDDPLLKLARVLALTHHERWDGTGYPSRAKGNDIPWAGRAMSIVDAFESMTATQFHREPMPIELAADEIVSGAGKQFDPVMVEAFRKALPELRKVHATYGDQLGDMLDLDFSSAATPAPEPRQAEQAEAMESRGAQAARDTDAARAKALADVQVRLKVERDLAAAASKDIVSQQGARKRAEERGAREAELLAAAKQRVTEETVAARMAQERAAAEASAEKLARERAATEKVAADLARQAQAAHLQTQEAVEARAAAELALATAAADRRQAEEARAKSAEARAAAEVRAAEARSRAQRAEAAPGKESPDEVAAGVPELHIEARTGKRSLWRVPVYLAAGLALFAAGFIARLPETPPPPPTVQAPPQPPPIIVAAPPPPPIFEPAADAPVVLRLETQFEKLAPREPAK